LGYTIILSVLPKTIMYIKSGHHGMAITNEIYIFGGISILILKRFFKIELPL